MSDRDLVVEQLRRIFVEMHTKNPHVLSHEVFAECFRRGFNSQTVRTQYYPWRRQYVAAKRGGTAG